MNKCWLAASNPMFCFFWHRHGFWQYKLGYLAYTNKQKRTATGETNRHGLAAIFKFFLWWLRWRPPTTIFFIVLCIVHDVEWRKRKNHRWTAQRNSQPTIWFPSSYRRCIWFIQPVKLAKSVIFILYPRTNESINKVCFFVVCCGGSFLNHWLVWLNLVLCRVIAVFYMYINNKRQLVCFVFLLIWFDSFLVSWCFVCLD